MGLEPSSRPSAKRFARGVQTVVTSDILSQMRSSPTTSRGWKAKTLTSDEWAQAERVAARIHSEFRALISSLPEQSRHASGMSRHLNVLRATCQRLVQALADPTPTPAMLTRLPGIEGLQQVLEGFRKTGSDSGEIGAAKGAIEALERFIQATAGSQTRLIERLNLGVGGKQGAEDSQLGGAEHRRDLYWSAARVTGRWCETALSVYAFRVDPSDPTVLERALAKGLIGSCVAPGGLPLLLSSGDTLKHDDEVRNIKTIDTNTDIRGRSSEAILRPFTTDPLPTVTSRGRGGTLSQIIDSNSSPNGEPIDVVTALRAKGPVFDPATGKPTLNAVWSLVNCPSEKLILDVYLHVDMERRYRPSVDALLWTNDLNVTEEQKWLMRVPSQPRLQLLGRSAAHSASALYPRHAELTRYFFDHIGWDDSEFIGFRCEVQYPVWRAGYAMGFEYLADAAASSEL